MQTATMKITAVIWTRRDFHSTPIDGVIGRPACGWLKILGAALQAGNEVRGDGLKHQKEKRSMNHFAGLDVSVKETSVCILDDAGKIVKEVNVASEPQALLLSALQIVPTPTSYSSASCTMVAPLA
jgi:hypothetical protein